MNSKYNLSVPLLLSRQLRSTILNNFEIFKHLYVGFYYYLFKMETVII